MSQPRAIKVNHIGYPTDAPKRAFFEQDGPFQIIDIARLSVVFEGTASGPIVDDVSGDTVYTGDFSVLAKYGQYRVEQGDFVSAPFVIHDNPYVDLQRGLLKAFYYYRCGMALTPEFADPWTHQACHTSHGIVHGDESRRLDSSGGWHDAGDYGKYVSPGAKSIADLLLAFEWNPGAFHRPLPLPESDGHTPDVLLECRWELEWLFKMQETESGGVFHKLTTLQFPELAVMPEDDNDDLYFMPISATATGSFAAIMALASRIYRSYDSEFADKCLSAARRAWEWLVAHPVVPGFHNPSNVGTGEYGDDVDADERYWAAAELYRATGDETYHQAFRELLAQPFAKVIWGWADVSAYGSVAYLWNPSSKTDAALKEQLTAEIVQEADRIMALATQDGYAISLTPKEYRWGSSMDVMHNALTLLVAHRLIGRRDYEEAALEHVHYLVGRNALDISYVTGFGDRFVKNPHYRPGVADGVDAPVPGMVSGGPNTGLQDDYAREHLQGMPPAKSFIDHQDSYSTNEVAIYWNSSALFALSYWVK